MNLSRQLELFLTPESLALIRLIRTEAERMDLPLYLVGGSVRDLMLGRAVQDFDLTVEGDAAKLAESVLRSFAGKVIFHSRFGTATWTLDETTFKRLGVPLLGASGFPPFLDFISARSETYLKPGALPTVKHSTIDDDLRRRDFTINAMALRLDGRFWGQLHDPLGGQSDLEKKHVRALHTRSFVDDPTRMLRAVRYSVRYGFEIEPETLNLINEESRAVLASLSGERLRHEIDLMFEESDPSTMLQHLGKWNLLAPIHSALQGANFQLPFLEILSAEFGDFTIPNILTLKRTLGWIVWLMPLSDYDVDAISKRLDFPTLLARAARAASALLGDIPSLVGKSPSQWTFHLEEMPAISVYAVYLVRKEPALREYLVKWRKVKPSVTGDHLKARGLEPGPRYAEILRQLRAAWLDGDVKNEDEEKTLLNKLIK
jgi:tRNA nucleotidyltransferase (CCA-adding enzyme)